MFIPLEKDGSILLKKYPSLGEWYSFKDRLKGMGQGSIKLHYKTGVAEFDKLNQLNVDTAFVNFEPTTKGMILRFNKFNRVRAFGIANTDIHQIEIKKIYINTKNIFTQKKRQKTKGNLFIKGNFNLIVLEIPVNRVDKIITFFKNLPISDRIIIS